MDYKLKDLIDTFKFQELLNSLTQEFEFAVSIIDNEGYVLAASGWKKFCTKFHHSNIESFTKCQENYNKALKKNGSSENNGPDICPHGLTEYSIPIVIEDKIMGSVFIGQIFTEKPDINEFKKNARRYFFDEKTYLEAVEALPIISIERLQNKLSFIKNLAEVIANSGLKQLEENKSAKQIAISEEKYRKIFDDATEGIYQSTPEGKYISVNPAFANMLGYDSPEEIINSVTNIGQELYAIPEERERLKALLKKDGYVNGFEISGFRKDGRKIIIKINVHSVCDETGKLIMLEGTCEDITEKKIIIETLEENEKMFRLLADNSADVIVKFSPDGKYLYYTPAMKVLFGYESDELIGKSPYDYIHPEDVEHVKEMQNKMVENSGVISFECRFRHKNGEYIWTDTTSRGIRGQESGNVIELQLATRDISQKKLFEIALKESQEKLNIEITKWNTTFDSITDSICLLDREGNVLQCNRSMKDVLGKADNEITYHKCHELVHHMDKRHENCPFDEMLKSKQSVRSEIYLGEKYFMVSADPVFDEAGEVKYAVHTLRDISKEKENERLVKEYYEKFRLIFENSSIGIVLVGPDTKFIKANEKFCSFIGYTEAELTTMSIKEITHPDYQAIDLKNLQMIKAGEIDTYKTEKIYIDKSGSEKWGSVSVSKMNDENGKFNNYIANIEDITIQKQLNEIIRMSEEKFAAAFINNPIIMTISSFEDKTFLDVNETFINKSGFERAEIIGKTALELEIWSKKDELEDMHSTLSTSGFYKNKEFDFKLKNGEYITCLVSAQVIEINGKKCILSVAEDITYRIKTEAQIRHLSSFPELNPLPVLEIDLDKNVIFHNEALEKALKDNETQDINVFFPENLDKIISLATRYINEPFVSEITVGGRIYSQSIHYTDEFKTLRLYHIDITTRMIFEEALHKSEEFLNNVIENIPDMVFVKDAANLRFVRLNKAGEELLGYSQEELFGKNDYDFFPEKEADFFTTNDRKVFDSKEFVYIPEETIQTKNKGERILRTKKIPIIDRNGVPIYLLGISEDITEKRMAERELEKSKEILKTTNTQLIEAQHIAMIGSWIHNLANPLPDWSEEMFTLFGLEIKKGTPDYPEFRSLIKQEQHEILDDAIRELITNGKSYALELNVLRPDGTERIIDLRSEVFCREGDNLISTIGTAQDITERKKAEETIRENEIKFRAIFENSVDAIGVAKRNAHVFVNSAYKKLFGINNDTDIFGVSVLELISPEKRAEMLMLTENRYNGVITPDDYETIGLRTDGTMFFMDVHVSTYEINNELYTLVIIRDITDRKMATEALRESERMMSTLISNLPGVVYRCQNDKELTMDYISEGCLELTGYSPEDLIYNSKISYNEIIHPDERENVRQLISKAIIDKSPFQTVYRIITKDKTEKWVWEQGKGVYDSFGNFNKLEGFITDITQSKLNEEELKNYRNHLEELVSTRTQELEKAKVLAESSTRAKSEFLANMSHEIRTPMNSIIGFADILFSRIKDEKQLSQLSSIRSSAKSLLGIINDILDLSKVEAGKLMLEYEPVDLKKVAQEIKNVFSHKIKEKGLLFNLEFSNDLPEMVLIDEVRFRQILFNIIGNAIKFTDKGFIKVFLKCNTNIINEQNKDIILIVEDTGMGIPEEQQDMIFEAFNQQSGQSTKKFGGTGLGLTITKRFIEMMKGSITLKSSVGKGSIFTIVFPDIEPTDNNLNFSNEKTYTPGQVIFEPATLLVCDDNESNRKLILDLLSDSPLNIFEAESGTEAIEKAKAILPDLILMDLKMPGIDGYDVTKYLKDNELTKKIPVIVLSASARLLKIDLKEEKLFDASLMKPINIGELISKLKLFLKYNENVSTEEKTVVSFESEIINAEITITNLSELVNILQNEMAPIHRKVADEHMIDKTVDFGKRLIFLGEEFRVDFLRNYGKNIVNYAENFEVDKLGVELSFFPELIIKIKSFTNLGD